MHEASILLMHAQWAKNRLIRAVGVVGDPKLIKALLQAQINLSAQRLLEEIELVQIDEDL